MSKDKTFMSGSVAQSRFLRSLFSKTDANGKDYGKELFNESAEDTKILDQYANENFFEIQGNSAYHLKYLNEIP